MHDNAKAIQAWLQAAFHDSPIDYREEGSLHRFRIETQPNPHSLYISDEFLTDKPSDELIDAAQREGIIPILRASKTSRWIYLGNDGSKEVDEKFTR